MHVCMYACMYVCVYCMYVCTVCMYLRIYVFSHGIGPNPRKREVSMYVCMYVCMSEAPEHVCMSLSNLQNLLVSEGVKFLTKNVQYLITNSIF